MNDKVRIHISALSRIQAAFQLTQLRKEINQGLLCALEYAEEVECLRLRAVGNSAQHEPESSLKEIDGAFNLVNIEGLILEHGVPSELSESRLRYWQEKTGAACFAV